jgi:hypothetical protein
MLNRRLGLALAALVAFVALGAGFARAEGVARVQQPDGMIEFYDHTSARLVGRTLWLRSGDHKGVLEVASDACAYAGEIKRCLPYSTILRQHGVSHQIALEHGMVYFNLTGDAHALPHSAELLGPHAVMVVLKSLRGTYVTFEGTLDAVK